MCAAVGYESLAPMRHPSLPPSPYFDVVFPGYLRHSVSEGFGAGDSLRYPADHEEQSKGIALESQRKHSRAATAAAAALSLDREEQQQQS